MKKSGAGMTALEIVTILFVLTLIFALWGLAARGPAPAAVRVKALVNHMKVVAAHAENQKRLLGGYPLAIDAMINRADYLRVNGNSANITEEGNLRNPWAGPYLKGFSIGEEVSGSQRRKFIDLTELQVPALRGYIEFSPNFNETLYHYSIYADTPAGTDRLSELAEEILNECNQERDLIRLKTDFAKDNFTTKSYQPCGYRSFHGKITRIHYYLDKFSPN